MANKPTKQQVEMFVSVRNSGMYNMVMDAKQVISFMGIDMETYLAIIKNFSDLCNEYGIEL